MEIFDQIEKKYKQGSTYEEKFMVLAKEILNNFTLKIKDIDYSIEEIEVYFKSDDHKDIYVHCDEAQLTRGQWYFHKFKSGAYKGGTFKGLDMTFGTKSDTGNKFGGILIRSISSDDEFITGPSNTVSHILSKTNFDSVSNLVDSLKTMSIDNKKNPFYVQYSKGKGRGKDIFTGPRVGLSFKDHEYTFINYRYLTNPKKIPKYRSTVISTLYKDGKTSQEITEATQLNESSVKKCIKDFDDGKDFKPTDEDMNVNIINILYGWFTHKTKQ